MWHIMQQTRKRQGLLLYVLCKHITCTRDESCVVVIYRTQLCTVSITYVMKAYLRPLHTVML